jgi:hypothetical protein
MYKKNSNFYQIQLFYQKYPAIHKKKKKVGKIRPINKPIKENESEIYKHFTLQSSLSLSLNESLR